MMLKDRYIKKWFHSLVWKNLAGLHRVLTVSQLMINMYLWLKAHCCLWFWNDMTSMQVVHILLAI